MVVDFNKKCHFKSNAIANIENNVTPDGFRKNQDKGKTIHSLHSPQKAGHSVCADGVVQKLGEAATSRRQASVLMSLHEPAAAVTPRAKSVMERFDFFCMKKMSVKKKNKNQNSTNHAIYLK